MLINKGWPIAGHLTVLPIEMNAIKRKISNVIIDLHLKVNIVEEWVE